MANKGFTIAIVLVIIASVIGILFLPEEISEKYGVYLFAVPITILVIIIVAAVIIGAKKNGGKGGKKERKKGKIKKKAKEKAEKKGDKGNSMSSKELQEKKEEAQEALKSAERKYLKHKIDKNTFDSILKESNTKLIELEAKNDALKRKGLPDKELKKMKYISEDKKKVLEDLFKVKASKIYELNIAEKKYLKRKISSDTYKKIKSDVDKELVSIDSKIKSIYKANEVNKIKQELKKGVDEYEKQMKISKKRSENQLEEDVLKQLPF